MRTISRTVSMLISLLLPFFTWTQEINRYYVYGCERCVISGFKAIGNKKVLLDYTRTNQRKMILLDSQNLVVDELRVGAPIDFFPASEHTILIPDLGEAVTVDIRNDRFEVRSMYRFLYDIMDQYHFGYPIVVGNFLIGEYSFWQKNDLPVFTYIPLGQDIDIIEMKGKNEEYGKKGMPVPCISSKDPHTLDRLNSQLESGYFINASLQEYPRAGYIPGWSSYSLNGPTLIVFSHLLQKLYWVDINGEKPKVYRELTLPLKDPEREGWIHYHDFARKTSYLLLDEKEPVKDGTVRRSRRGGHRNSDQHHYTLYTIQQDRLVPLMELRFRPLDIEDGRVYEMKQDDRSYNIYGYPLFDERDELIRVFFETQH